MKVVTSVGVFLLIFLTSTTLVESSPSVYLVESLSYSWQGIYKEISDPELHYKRIGEPDSSGDYSFLYREPDHNNTWTFGDGKDLSTVDPIFRAPAIAGKPTSTQWKHLREGNTWDFKVVEVKNIGAEELKKKLKEGYVTEEGTIFCWRTRSKAVQIIPKDDCRICNINRDCDSGQDEANCPAYVAPSFEIPIYCTLVVLLTSRQKSFSGCQFPASWGQGFTSWWASQ